MTAPVNDVLRDIIDRHGRLLFDHASRFEACLRDNALPPRDLAGLVAAQKDGVPKRLAAQPAGVLTQASLDKIAEELSDHSGLSDAVAASAVSAIAYALRLDVGVDKPPAPDPLAAKVAPRPEVGDQPQPPGPAKRKVGDLIGAILSVPAMLLLWGIAFNGGLPIWQALFMFAAGAGILAEGGRAANRFFARSSPSPAPEIETPAK